jgi:Bax protein
LVTAAVVGLVLRGAREVDVERVATVQELAGYYTSLGYTLEAPVTENELVPRVYLSAFPEDWSGNVAVALRKSLFFRSVIPLLLAVNETIGKERRRLSVLRRIIGRGDSPGKINGHWLATLAVRYRVRRGKDTEGPPSPRELAELARRVDAVPVSMALAQAAVESAYGTSRFARQGNALFGQWSTGEGMVPKQRGKAAGDHRIAAFSTLLESVRAYAKNLNTHAAYRKFRQSRAAQRSDGHHLDGQSLSAHLGPYAETGAAYIATVRRVIRQNGLGRLDGARFGTRRTALIETAGR